MFEKLIPYLSYIPTLIYLSHILFPEYRLMKPIMYPTKYSKPEVLNTTSNVMKRFMSCKTIKRFKEVKKKSMLQSDQIYYHDIEFCIGGVNMIFSGNNLTNNQNHKKEEDKKTHVWIYVSGVGGLMILQIDCYMGLHPPYFFVFARHQNLQ